MCVCTDNKEGCVIFRGIFVDEKPVPNIAGGREVSFLDKLFHKSNKKLSMR